MRISTLITLPALGAVLSGITVAQVGYGTDAPSDDENFILNVGSGVSTGPLFTGQEMYGLADDDTNMLLYMSEEGSVYSWAYGSASTPALVIDPVDPANGNSIRCEAMAHIGGVLYGVDEFGGAGLEGIYSFDLVTGDATPFHIYSNPALDIGGLDANPTTGLFYGSSDAAAARGIVELDAVMVTETILSAYPGALSDIDGVAVSPAGDVYLIQDEPNPIDIYNIGSAMYTGTLPSAVAAARVFSAGTWSDVLSMDPVLGTNYCMANANSTGSAATISADGSSSAASNDVTLTVSDMPNASFGFFLTSQMQGFTPNPGGSEGNLCLGGMIGRYVGPGQIQNSGMTGSISLVLDLTMTPTPMGLVSVQAGETWNFTAWFRDSNMGMATSNFADGLQIDFL